MKGINKDGKDIPKTNHKLIIKNPVDDSLDIASAFHNPNKIIAKFGLLFNYIMEGKDIFLPA